jgi:hypothetical protein
VAGQGTSPNLPGETEERHGSISVSIIGVPAEI